MVPRSPGPDPDTRVHRAGLCTRRGPDYVRRTRPERGTAPCPADPEPQSAVIATGKEVPARMRTSRPSKPQVPATGADRALVVAVLGAAGGVLGVWAMDQVGWFMLRAESRHALVRDLQARPSRESAGAGTTAQGRSVRRNPVLGTGAAGATTKATQVSGVSAPSRQPGPPAVVFHYGLGMLPGALYATARRTKPSLGTGCGTLYGLGLFVLMDETAAPLTGIASAPGRYPWQAHARGLVAHLVLGVTTEACLRAAERLRRARHR